jgi:hypothetical protein
LQQVLLNPHIPPAGTPYMMAFEAQALAQCGCRAEMLATMRRYWGGMLDAGATTFWEGYDAQAQGAEHLAFYGCPFAKSLCHAWSAGPVLLLSRDLMGLRPTAAGWSRCVFTPAPPPLAWLCAAIPTPHGPISIEIDEIRTHINIPAGVTLEMANTAGDMREDVGPAAVIIPVMRP